MNTCADAVRAIRATSRSHDRPHVIEVMGRDCGDIALSTAAATGAEIVVVPEVKWSVDQVADQLNWQIKRGNTRATVVIAEGCWASMEPFDVYSFLKPFGKQVYEGEPMTAERFASVLKRKCGMIEVRGKNLSIHEMRRDALMIRGEIRQMELPCPAGGDDEA
mgnify:CR=1 FL=1